MKLPGILSALLVSLLSYPLLGGETPQTASTTPPSAVYPDQGYLSATRYTNRYFGFAVDLPAGIKLEPVPQPVARDDRIQLLQLAGPPPELAAVSMMAFPLRSKPTVVDAKVLLRKALDQELLRGVEELHGLSKTTLNGHLFYFYETRRGADQHMALATNLEGYAVLMVVAANDEKTVKELETSIQHLTFLAPAKTRESAGADAQEYEGPTISSHRLAQLQADPPVNHIDAGKVSGNLYENHALGFSYPIPAGWTLQPEGAVLPAIERSRKRDYENPWMGDGERQLLKLCDRNLFSAWAKPAASDGQMSYDDFGEVTVSAAAAACFPGMKFPTSSTDRQAVKDFLLGFGFTHPIVRDMRDAKAFTSNGSVVVFLRGTVAFQVPDDELSRRLSIAMAVTLRRGYLLTWFFAAPHDGELKELLDEKVAFDAEPLSTEASTAKPGGGEIAPVSSQPVVQAPASAAIPNSPPHSGPGPMSSSSQTITPPANGDTPSPGEATQQDAPAGDASSPPSLLRPGESMKDQQVNGKPLPPRH
jgi:hypothetical protein